MPKTTEDRVNTVYGGGGHVVILGAGASIASTFRNPDSTGKQLPSMDNFLNIVGLNDIVNSVPERLRSTNFEDFYSKLHADNPTSKEIFEIEDRVRNYFSNMRLPNEPTIYDYLVLSLRKGDLIATFNWDPYLYQAWCRNGHIGEKPSIMFLHGNVAIGYRTIDKRSGPAGVYYDTPGGEFVPTKLLYPVTKKNYNDDEFIKSQWDTTKIFLSDKNVKRITVFGYGAPKSDTEAMKLIDDAWITTKSRLFEQFEMINIAKEKEVKKSWKLFKNSNYFDYVDSYFKSSLAYNPRRTSESDFQHLIPYTPDEALSASNPIPSDFSTLEELWEWHKPLIEAENKWRAGSA